MANTKIEQLRILVAEILKEGSTNFGRVNALTTELKNLRSLRVSRKMTTEEIDNLLLQLPQPITVTEKVAVEDWVEYDLWKWTVIAKAKPSKSLKKDMLTKKGIFWEHASFIQKEEFKNIFSVVEKM